MTHHNAINDAADDTAKPRVAQPSGRGPNGAGAGLARPPDRIDLLRLLLRAQIGLGDRAGAQRTAARIAGQPGQPDALEVMLDAALAVGAVAVARDALSTALGDGALPAWRAACLKARIALETGDHLAAKAILVMALERGADTPTLRAMLTEVMVAAGTASDARAVLHHAGRPPAAPEPPSAPAPDAEGGATDSRTG